MWRDVFAMKTWMWGYVFAMKTGVGRCFCYENLYGLIWYGRWDCVGGYGKRDCGCVN